jgi:Amidase
LAADLHFLTILEAAERIAARRLSPVELTEAYLARIAALDDQLDSFVTVTSERARHDARKAEAEIMTSGPRGPLHGIPYGLKDIFDVVGVRTTAQSRLLADNVPVEDSVCAARLESAGAILLGKNATWEFAHGGPSWDVLFPPARNPWNTDHSPAGSSSGSAVAVAAGLAPMSLGTDTGGSIRSPAAACGVAGLKPTYGRVSRRGIVPNTPIWKLLNLPEFEPMTTFRRRKERLPLTGDQRIDNKPKFIHQPGIDEARRNSGTPHEIDVLARSPLEGRDVFDSPEEACLRPKSGSQGARQHIMRGLLNEAGPFDLTFRWNPVRQPVGLVRLILYRGPILLVVGVHAAPDYACIYLLRQAVVLRPRLDPIRVALRPLNFPVDRHLHSGNQFTHANLLFVEMLVARGRSMPVEQVGQRVELAFPTCSATALGPRTTASSPPSIPGDPPFVPPPTDISFVLARGPYGRRPC